MQSQSNALVAKHECLTRDTDDLVLRQFPFFFELNTFLIALLGAVQRMSE